MATLKSFTSILQTSTKVGSTSEWGLLYNIPNLGWVVARPLVFMKQWKIAKTSKDRP